MIALFIMALLTCVTVGGFLYLRMKAKEYSRALFGTDDLSRIQKTLEETEDMINNTPRSVTAMTRVYLPYITRDFPDFNFDEMKERSKNVLLAFLKCIDSNSMEGAEEFSEDLKESLSKYITMLSNEEKKEHFKSIAFHQTEISQYVKNSGKCRITFQSAIKCLHYIEKDGELIAGSKDRDYQTKFEVDLVYIQDRDKLSSTDGAAMGINCPNCGAPIKVLGRKYCEYCGAGITEVNVKAWRFEAVRECKSSLSKRNAR